MNRDLVLGPLTAMLISRLTLDFDGSVLSAGRFAEGTAVGFNKQKKVGLPKKFPNRLTAGLNSGTRCACGGAMRWSQDSATAFSLEE